MNTQPVVSAITMEDGGQSEGASDTTLYAARLFAAVAREDAASGKHARVPATPAPVAPCTTYNRSQDISFNLC